jgi:hypothetical protein
MNIDSTYNLSSVGVRRPEPLDSSHIIPHGVKLVRGQVEPLRPRPTGLRDGTIHLTAFSSPSLTS